VVTAIRALPHMLIYTGGYLLLRPLVQVRSSMQGPLPPRSLVYGFHEILLPGILASKHIRNIVWVNNDTVGGIAGSAPAFLAGLRIFRLSSAGMMRPYDQLAGFLRSVDVPVGILTDGGKRDRLVRASLPRLALDSDRPLVPMAISVSRCARHAGQVYPLPLSVIAVKTGEPISPRDIADLTKDDSRDYLSKSLLALSAR
jgi:hypothetical protein